MTAPAWSPVDDDTADLLSLVADTDHPSVSHEWDLFKEAIITASLFDGIVRPNDMRPMLAGRVAPRRIGSFYRKACLEGLIEPTADWQVSDDARGHNVGKPAKIYRRPTTPPATPSDVSPVAGGSQGRPVSPAWPADPSP